jgi:hypothetical protein
MQITITDEEKEVLKDVLDEVLPSLRGEVYKTESFDYREELKRREAIIKLLLERLR